MTVLVKPNMVLSWHPGGDDPNLDTMITNPSVVRAVLDYVAIALKGTGTIIVGECPPPVVRFRQVDSPLGDTSAWAIFTHPGECSCAMSIFVRYGHVITTMAFSKLPKRRVTRSGIYSWRWEGKVPTCDVRKYRKNFRVTNYDHRKMRHYHTVDNDRYLISGTALSADVIITMPKLKTHRKAV